MKISCPTCKDILYAEKVPLTNSENYRCKICKFYLSFDCKNNKITSYSFRFILNDKTYVLNSYNLIIIIESNLKLILKMNKTIFPLFDDEKVIIRIDKYLPPKDYSNINDYMYVANKLFKLNIFS